MKKIISFIGAGNVAWHLTEAFQNAGFQLGEIYSRKIENANLLCKKLGSLGKIKAQNHLNFTDSQSEIFILSIADSAYENVLKQIQLPDKAILLHTSGSLPLESLQKVSSNIAVFYPLQTFSKAKKVNFQQIPFCLEANSDFVGETVHNLAKCLSSKIYFLNSKERAVLHVAAVFACNFGNHLWNN